MIRISIVIPSYNQGMYIEQAIQSILSQNYPIVELIIIDGGSEDSSLDIIRQYEHQLAWSFSKKDRGQSQAINFGYSRCTGDLITFMSSDDIYLPGTFEHVTAIFDSQPEKEKIGAIVGAFVFMDENSNIDNTPIVPYISVDTPNDLSHGYPYRLHQVSTFYTRHALDAVGRFVREDLHYTMDRELLYRVAREFKILTTEQVYSAFRRHIASKSVSQVLPFAHEFAQLHRSWKNGNEKEDKLREKVARHYIAKGYLKYARLCSNRFQAYLSLMRAPRYQPGILLRRSYWVRYVKLAAGIRG